MYCIGMPKFAYENQNGTGIPRLYNRSAEYGLPEPLFEEFGNGIKVTMFRKVSSNDGKVSSDKEKVSGSAQKINSNNEKKVVHLINIFHF